MPDSSGVTLEQLLRVGVGSAGESLFDDRQRAVQAGADKLDPDIERLTAEELPKTKITLEQLLRIGVDHTGKSIFDDRQRAVQAGANKLNPEIERLTAIVLEAAAGKPLKTSITMEKRKEKLAQNFLAQFITKMFTENPDGELEQPVEDNEKSKKKVEKK